MAGFSECPSLKGFVHFWTLTNSGSIRVEKWHYLEGNVALCEEEVGEVDFGGFLGGSGVVFKEGADAEVEVVSGVKP